MLIHQQRSRLAQRQRIKSNWPMSSPAGTVGIRRRGVTATELLLVIGIVGCLLLSLQGWSSWQMPLARSSTSINRMPGDDPAPLTALAVNLGRTEVASVGLDGVLRFHDLKNHKCVGEVQNQYGDSRALCYSADGSRLLVCNGDGHFELWSIAKGTVTSRTQLAHQGEVCYAAFAPDGNCFVTCGGDRRCIVWNSESLQPLFELDRGPVTVRQACFNEDGTELVTGDMLGTVRHWSVARRTLIRKLQVANPRDQFKSYIVGLSMFPGTSRVMIATRCGELSVWDLETGEPRRIFQTDGRELMSMNLTRDGRCAVSGGIDGQIDVWDTTNGKCLQTVDAHVGPVSGVNVVQEHNMIVSAGWDGQLKFWDM